MLSRKIKSVSFVIPLYNEQKRIVKTLPKIETFLTQFEKSAKIKPELILVNDGSTDSTIDVVKNILKFKNTKLVNYKNNQGKGYALKQGFKKATGDYILFMDADLSTPLKHIYDFLNQDLDEKTIVIGSRKMKGAKVTKHQPWIRENLGKGFTLISNIFLVWGITDFTCGFKMFPKKIGKKIFSNVTINRWGYDSEVLYLAKKYNCKIVQVPVSWKNDGDSKVKLKRDVLGSLVDIFNIKKNSIKGDYKK